MKKIKKQGFTLIEILVVILLLSLLVGIIVPSVMKLYDKIKMNAFVAQSQTIYKAAKEQYNLNKAEGNLILSYCDDGESEDEEKLMLSKSENYCYKITFEENKIVSFEVSNDEFSVTLNGEAEASDISNEVKAKNETGYNKVTCTSSVSAFVQISGGYYHTVFLKEEGTVWAVGDNSVGQLGDGTTTSNSYPVQVKKDENTNLTGVKSISTGNYHTVFLMENGTVWAVGDNFDGQLGDGTEIDRSYPVQVKKDASTNLTGVKSTSAGSDYTVFLMEDGTVWAVGVNHYGQLGNGTTENTSYSVQVKKDENTNLTGVKSTSAGHGHTVFLMENGSVWAVGSNDSGQLGDGTTTQRLYPVDVMLNSTTVLTGVKSISTGFNHTVFLIEDGSVRAVGNNGGGNLGDGTTENRSYPVQVMSDENTPFTGAKIATAGAYFSIFYKDDGMWATGENSDGQLGDGTTQYKYYPVQVLFN